MKQLKKAGEASKGGRRGEAKVLRAQDARATKKEKERTKKRHEKKEFRKAGSFRSKRKYNRRKR